MIIVIAFMIIRDNNNNISNVDNEKAITIPKIQTKMITTFGKNPLLGSSKCLLDYFRDISKRTRNNWQIFTSQRGVIPRRLLTRKHTYSCGSGLIHYCLVEGLFTVASQ